MNFIKNIINKIHYMVAMSKYEKFRSASYKIHLENHKSIEKTRTEVNKMYAQGIQFVDSGAIVVSFTYLLQTRANIAVIPMILLNLSWLCLITSIIKSLYSHKLSCKLHDDALDREHLCYTIGVGDSNADDEKKYKDLVLSTSKDGDKVNKLNDDQLLLTVIGIILLSLFIVISLWTTRLNSRDISENNTCVKECIMNNKEKDKLITDSKGKKVKDIKDGFKPAKPLIPPSKPIEKPVIPDKKAPDKKKDTDK